MRDKLNKLSNWLNNNDLEEESSAVSKMLSKYAEEDAESDDRSSGEYWDFSIDNAPDGWSSSSFSPEDLMSRGNRRVRIYRPALRALNNVASKRPAGKPVLLTNQVNSSKNGAYRDKRYNSSVGGASGSQHIDGRAFDIHVSNHSKEERLLLLQALVDAGFTGFGHGRSVIHADFGPKRFWAYSGYRKPSEEEYRGGSSGSVVSSVDVEQSRRSERRSERRSNRRSRSCAPPFDRSLLDRVRAGETLRIRSRGPQVGYMQTLLEERGHMLRRFGVDCIFGRETRGRLRDFQRALGLSVTGKLDGFTLSFLEDKSKALRVVERTAIEIDVHELDNKYPQWNKLGIYKKSKSNFHSIGDGKNNFRSAALIKSTEFFLYLKEKYGIKNVINLKSEGGQRKFVVDAKYDNYLSVPLGGRGPRESDWADIRRLLSSGNTLVHCRHGADRTGAVVARWKIEQGLMGPDEAFQEALTYGFKKKSHPGYTGMPEDADPNRRLRSYILRSKPLLQAYASAPISDDLSQHIISIGVI
jgi:peptidoglycan hydrolase-like protein with peptidoglycan-binding domain